MILAAAALALATLASSVYAVPTSHSSGPSLTVSTSSGTLHGGVNASTPHVRQWLNVPFAQAPVGPLRWLPAKALPASAKSKELNVTTWGPSCIQYEPPLTAYNDILREYLIWGPQDEDCLTVSIWAPTKPTKAALPVFLWTHGGGDVFGSANVPGQDPAKWVERTQSHLVVSIQWRLNIFGFPNAEGLDQTNLGFSDQRVAVEWARDNIAAFGGDAKSMVLWGQSAGGQSALYYAAAYPNDPIVHGIIANSPGGLQTGAYTPIDRTNFTFVASKFGCSTGNSSAILDCMRKVRATDLEAFVQYYQDSATAPAIAFRGAPDNVQVPANYTERLADKKVAAIPLLIGNVANEERTLIPYAPGTDVAGPNLTITDAATKELFCAGRSIATARTSYGLTTYRYQYNGNFTNLSPLPWMGAFHCSELPMIFGNYGDWRGGATTYQTTTAEKMQDAYLAFAVDPENGLEEWGWPKYSEGKVEFIGGAYNGAGVAARAAQAIDVAMALDTTLCGM